MTTTPDTPTPPPVATTPYRRAPRLPSLRASAALAAGMLAIGVAIGAAIGPAPSASFAGQNIAPLVLPSIAALSARYRRSRERYDRRPAAAGHAPTHAGGENPDCRSWRIRSRPPRRRDPIDELEGTGERGRLAKLDFHPYPNATSIQNAKDRRRQADDAPAGHERMADHALRRHLRAGARPSRRRSLHRLPARARRNAVERLVLARRQLVRERGGAALRRSTPDAGLDRPTPLPRRRGGRAVRNRNLRRAERGGRILESHRARDHLERRLPGTRPDRDHFRARSATPPPPACPPEHRPRRSAPRPRGRAVALTVCPRRRTARKHLQPNFTQAEPFRASALDVTPQSVN